MRRGNRAEGSKARMKRADVGLIGLAAMGQNLALNIESRGYTVAVSTRTAQTIQDFIAAHPEKRLIGRDLLGELVAAIARPHRIILMVKAGEAVDALIDQLKPLLEPGDLIVDGGNSYFVDTERREKELAALDIRFLGAGISGGEVGALRGPSIMPGGRLEAYEMVRDLFIAIAAKVDGNPCVAYLGPGGAGHYVKMVHNGIEYGQMQLIAETYDLLRRGLGLPAPEMAPIFAAWNQGEVQSYLVEITARVLAEIDGDTGVPLVDVILDEAEQKGTGKWTSQNALDLGVPLPTINAAVEARLLSALKEERVVAASLYDIPERRFAGAPDQLISDLGKAFHAASICCYAQGLALLREASHKYAYDLNLGEIAGIWRGGCIIRAGLLNHIRDVLESHPNLLNLLLDDGFRSALLGSQAALRRVVSTAITLGIPVPALSSALAYFDAYQTARLPANLIQAQRDFFGAHTFRRVDREGTFHRLWQTPD